MGRWSHLDTDEERLPEGMARVGYDADTQVYTYRDSDGSYWEGAPGVQYGKLHRVRSSAPPLPSVRIPDDMSGDEQPYVLHDYDDDDDREDSSDLDDDDDPTNDFNEKKEEEMLPTSPDKAILHPHHPARAALGTALPQLPTTTDADADGVSTGSSRSSTDSLEKHSTPYGRHSHPNNAKETATPGLKRAGTLSRLARFLSSSASSAAAGAGRTLPRRATVGPGEGAAAAASIEQRQGREARRAGYAAGAAGASAGAGGGAAAAGTRGPPTTRKKRATTFDEILGVDGTL
ncbi:hypothetical protein C8A01DRAFT_49205 [Parachaetomium inaequale]|uniref:Uncharacterized protein n=1 Tax=Parachaetomium inaequale TaxID=2588326 RepID=A0AAN6P9S7_9PEZI|nr:hypothetical protein C8A01DRAFT_49205 [Parachaetomium inaequale]